MEPPRISVIIPTFQRKQLACAAVTALARQRYDKPFEVIVVVDGSRDGTATALRSLATPVELAVIEQPNSGAATARARGAAQARGEILLFLDDDMEAHEDLLSEHDRAHREGAEVVLGHLPLHPESPRNFLSAGVGRWAESRHRALLESANDVRPEDFLTGQLSVSRRALEQVGGFDTSFNREGSYGHEDLELGVRLARAGFRIFYRPTAISRQRYVVTPRHYLRQYEQAGAAAVAMARKHPGELKRAFADYRAATRPQRWAFRLLGWSWREAVMGLLALGVRSERLERAFYRLRDLGFWRGVDRAGGVPRRRPLRVLAYHAMRDLRGAPVVAEYGIPPEQLRAQLRLLRRCGFNFVDEPELCRFLFEGAGLPRRPLLLTFDDAYEELPEQLPPLLAELRTPAVVFAVAGKLGGHNEWDVAIGAPRLSLSGAAGLRRLERAGVAIGSHTLSHPRLTKAAADELASELRESADLLAAAGVRRPVLLSYPHGLADARVARAAADAGYRAAFTVIPGVALPEEDPLRLPRIEIFRRDRGLGFLVKVLLAGRKWTALFSMVRTRMREL